MKDVKRNWILALCFLAVLVMAFAGSQLRPKAPSVPFDLAAIPSFREEPWVEINGGVPYFEPGELIAQSFERYSELDALGRCGVAYACVGLDLMPTEERESIGQIKPSGWHTVRYDDLVDGKYLYNRCHVIGYQLTGENANEENLITGTRYLNTKGMQSFENQVASYVKSTGNHVLYRVTPVFVDAELVARGVLMEAQSVEDNGRGVRFCVYAYNAQPGIEIDYLTGESRRADAAPTPSPEPTPAPSMPAQAETDPAAQPTQDLPESPANSDVTYIANKNSLRFHRPNCHGVADMKESNKLELTLTREEVIDLGYTPCKICNP